VALIGSAKLRDLTAPQVRSALVKLSADRSTRTLQIARNSLIRAIRHAEANDLVAWNVAALVNVPSGQDGRPSKSLTAEQASSLLQQSTTSRLPTYCCACSLVAELKKPRRFAGTMSTSTVTRIRNRLSLRTWRSGDQCVHTETSRHGNRGEPRGFPWPRLKHSRH